LLQGRKSFKTGGLLFEGQFVCYPGIGAAENAVGSVTQHAQGHCCNCAAVTGRADSDDLGCLVTSVSAISILSEKMDVTVPKT